MIVLSEGETLDLEFLPAEIRGSDPKPATAGMKDKVETISRANEKQMIIEALEKTNQNRTRAARLLLISRRTLQNKIKKYGL